MEAIEELNARLLGSYLSRFSVGDTWELRFNDLWISAQNIVSADEKFLNDFLRENYQPFQATVDQDDISKCAIVATCMQKTVIGLRLGDSCNLTIDFEDNRQLVLTTNTSIVDWQWSLSENGSIPYADYIVACFWEGEIEVNKDKIKK